MNKLFYLVIFLFLISACSFNKNSKFWTSSKDILKEKEINIKKVLIEVSVLEKEFNSSLKIKLSKKINKDLSFQNYFNNNGRLGYDGDLKKSSRYKFSRIKNFDQFEPE